MFLSRAHVPDSCIFFGLCILIIIVCPGLGCVTLLRPKWTCIFGDASLGDIWYCGQKHPSHFDHAHAIRRLAFFRREEKAVSKRMHALTSPVSSCLHLHPSSASEPGFLLGLVAGRNMLMLRCPCFNDFCTGLGPRTGEQVRF
jgi:hypothetical protein